MCSLFASQTVILSGERSIIHNNHSSCRKCIDYKILLEDESKKKCISIDFKRLQDRLYIIA